MRKCLSVNNVTGCNTIEKSRCYNNKTPQNTVSVIYIYECNTVTQVTQYIRGYACAVFSRCKPSFFEVFEIFHLNLSKLGVTVLPVLCA